MDPVDIVILLDEELMEEFQRYIFFRKSAQIQ